MPLPFAPFLLLCSALQEPAKKPAGSEEARYESLADLQRAFDDGIARTTKTLNEKRLEALEAYAGRKPAPPDREGALLSAAETAFHLERWDAARRHGEAYLAEYPQGSRRDEFAVFVAHCLANTPDKRAEAKAAFDKVVEKAGASQEGFNALNALCDFQTEWDDLEGARATLEKLATLFKDQAGLEGFVAQKRANLDRIGADPQPIEAKDLAGNAFKLSDWKGKVVLVDFWATWCAPCIQELPNVLAAYRKHHAGGFEIVGVSLDRPDDEKKLREFVAARSMAWPQILNTPEVDLAKSYGVQSIPATFLVDRAGKLRAVGLRGPSLEKAIARLLAEPAKPAGEGKRP